MLFCGARRTRPLFRFTPLTGKTIHRPIAANFTGRPRYRPFRLKRLKRSGPIHSPKRPNRLSIRNLSAFLLQRSVLQPLLLKASDPFLSVQTLSVLFGEIIMRPLIRLGALVLLSFAVASTVVYAHGFTVGSLKIIHPWSRATPNGAEVAGGYLAIENTGQEADRLVDVVVEGVSRAEIHEMTTIDGVMKMRPLPNGLELPPGKMVELKPGGFHIMLMGLKVPVTEGSKLAGKLRFEKAGSVDVMFNVEAAGAVHDHSTSN